jgi:hypothetical protein
MSDQRSYRLATHMEIILAQDVAASNGHRKFHAGEIVQVLLDPAASVKVYRQDESKGVIATMNELNGAQIVRRLHD